MPLGPYDKRLLEARAANIGEVDRRAGADANGSLAVVGLAPEEFEVAEFSGDSPENPAHNGDGKDEDGEDDGLHVVHESCLAKIRKFWAAVDFA